MALPATLQAGSISSLGCTGNRVYTGLGDDEMYFVVRGKNLAALADTLDTIGSEQRAAAVRAKPPCGTGERLR